MNYHLQYISQEKPGLSHQEAILAACRAGCKWIQLRVKDREPAEVLLIGREVRDICSEYNATFILNDHVDLVVATRADGLHLGQLDTPHSLAREKLGRDCIIGGTANTFEQIQKYATEGVIDYVGVGPFRYTTTKQKLSPILGLEGYRSIVKQCCEAGIKLPVIAIGGILLEDVRDIMQTGVSGIAASGLITNASDQTAVVGELYSIIENS